MYEFCKYTCTINQFNSLDLDIEIYKKFNKVLKNNEQSFCQVWYLIKRVCNTSYNIVDTMFTTEQQECFLTFTMPEMKQNRSSSYSLTP